MTTTLPNVSESYDAISNLECLVDEGAAATDAPNTILDADPYREAPHPVEYAVEPVDPETVPLDPGPRVWLHPAQRDRRDPLNWFVVVPAWLVNEYCKQRLTEQQLIGYLRLRAKAGKSGLTLGSREDLAKLAGWTERQFEEWIERPDGSCLKRLLTVGVEALDPRDRDGYGRTSWIEIVWKRRKQWPELPRRSDDDERLVSNRDGWVPSWWVAKLRTDGTWTPVDRPRGSVSAAMSIAINRDDMTGETDFAAEWLAASIGVSVSTWRRGLRAAEANRITYTTGTVTGAGDVPATRVAVLHPDEWQPSARSAVNCKSPGRPRKSPKTCARS